MHKITSCKHGGRTLQVPFRIISYITSRVSKQVDLWSGCRKCTNHKLQSSLTESFESLDLWFYYTVGFFLFFFLGDGAMQPIPRHFSQNLVHMSLQESRFRYLSLHLSVFLSFESHAGHVHFPLLLLLSFFCLFSFLFQDMVQKLSCHMFMKAKKLKFHGLDKSPFRVCREHCPPCSRRAEPHCPPKESRNEAQTNHLA